MTFIQSIINFLDAQLELFGSQSFTAPEANKLLEIAGILNDNSNKPGRPLRCLLREKKLPHAHQVKGPGSKWIIPHS